jgi:carbonic anhydrase
MDCVMPTFSNENLTKIKEDLGVDTTGQDFLPFPDLKQSVRNSDLIPDDIVVSAIYDVHTGELREVVQS